MKTLASLALIIITFSACSQSYKSSDFKTYSTEAYTVQYPANWRIDTSKQNKAEFSIFSPKETLVDKFSENINLIIQDFKGQNIDLKKYAQISEEQIKANAKDLEKFSMKKIRVPVQRSIIN
ncbi:MAG: hypothetical protein H7Y86_19465 [Rhizobacter sp.]|nr:hypothetical protein [Ferruginibacter sp.]